jgi:hypothetical protein
MEAKKVVGFELSAEVSFSFEGAGVVGPCRVGVSEDIRDAKAESSFYPLGEGLSV